MATSGSQGNTFRTGYRLQVDWVRTSVSTDGNYSVITAYLYLISLGGAYTISSSTTKNWSITIDGTPYSGTCTVGLSANETKLLGSASKTVYHNADGYKSLSVSADCAMNVTLSGVYWGTVSTGTGYWDLDPIARASQPSLSASSIQMGSAVTIYTNRASTSFTHTIKYSFGNASGTIATGVTDSSAWTLPLATLAPQIPSSKSGVGTITVETYSGSTYIGSKTVQFTATISEGQASPTFANVTASELNSAVSTVVGAGIYVQNLSNIRIGFSAITYQYGASLAQCKINYNGSDYIASSIDTGAIPWTSSTITATLTDTRGFTCVRTLSLTAKPYLPPAISAFAVQRCLSDGTLNDLGTYVKITRAGTASTLVNGTEKNTITAKVFYSPRGANNWTELTACTVTNSTNVAGAVASTPITITTVSFSIESSYDFRFDLIDKFYTTNSPSVLPVGATVMSLSDRGVGIGKIWQQGALDVAGEIYENSQKLSDKYSRVYVSQVADFNTALTEGGYYVGSMTTIPNAPYTGSIFGKLRVYLNDGGTHNNNNNWIWQYFDDTSNRTYIRCKTNSSPWGNWRSVPRADEAVLRSGFTTSAYSFYNNITLNSNPNGMAVGLYNNGNWNAPFVTNPVKNTTYYMHNGIKYLAMNISLSTECLVEVDVTANLTSSGVNSFYSKVAIFNGFIGSETTQVFSGDEVVFTPSASYWTQVNTKALCILPAGNYSVWTTYRPDSTFTGTVGTAISHMKVVLYRR